jgi:hypothetical protein
MTEPSAGAVGPGDDAGAADARTDGAGTDGARTDDARTDAMARFAELQDRPVTEQVEVFEAEHSRLQTELDTIDRL